MISSVFGNTIFGIAKFPKPEVFMFHKVEICGINTSGLKLLTEEEKMDLLRKARAGSESAREKLILGNLRLVLSVIQSFQNRGENPDDLFQVGCIGLIKAVDNFDLSQEVKFSTYAVPLVVGEVRRYLRDNSMLRVPRSLRDLAYQAMKAKEKLKAALNRDPTVEEVAKELGESPKAVQNALDAIVDPISLYDPVYSDSGDSVYVLDQISDNSSTDESWLDSIAIGNAMQSLSPRERRSLTLRFYNGKTQTEVSREIGISQAQISRLEKNALQKVRKQMT